jgi:hypothetical protein
MILLHDQALAYLLEAQLDFIIRADGINAGLFKEFMCFGLLGHLWGSCLKKKVYMRTSLLLFVIS